METLLQTFISDSGLEERRSRESELRSLETYRLRLEHEARVADELARIDVLARRLSSRPPPAIAAPAHSAPPPAMSSASQLPFGDASSGSWPALSIDVAAPEDRAATPAPARLSLIAVAVAVSAILSFAGLAFVLGPSSAQTARANAVAQTQPVAASLPGAATHATCGTEAKATDAAPVAQTAAAAQPAKAPEPTPVTRTAKRASHAARNAPAASPSPTPAVVARTPATPDMDQAARTAQMLREQLGTSLR